MSVIEHAASNYRAATEEFLQAARAATAGDLDRHHPEGWSARQVIHHIADVSALAYGRLVFLAALPHPTIVAFDEEAIAQCPALGYDSLPVEPALDLIASVRERAAQVIGRLDVADLDRVGRHTERGEITLAQWIDMDTRHAREHAQQITHALRGEI